MIKNIYACTHIRMREDKQIKLGALVKSDERSKKPIYYQMNVKNVKINLSLFKCSWSYGLYS